MLFNSDVFIFAFLPLTLAGFYAFREWFPHNTPARLFLLAASLGFYGWWDWSFLPLMIGSIVANFALGRLLLDRADPGPRRWILAGGIAANLAALGWFKYAMFVAANVRALAGIDLAVGTIVLPIGISFYTFTQIAFLADAFQRRVRERNFVDYALFVTFFPHLIAGPIVHHAEMMPQFAATHRRAAIANNLAVGLTIFTLGLFKKVVFADAAARYATPIFALANQGETIGFAAAWQGALAYTVQIYFDFSGYSDMAIGLARLFGIRLPLNFNSPYKSASITEFWRRWHMTLSRFLRDYLYIPLGGNRLGARRRLANVLLVMLLAGAWHGAGWTFVVWGGLHGVYLVVHQIWLRRATVGGPPTFARRLAAQALTFLAVVVAWVMFRAESLDAAMAIFGGMLGLHGAIGEQSRTQGLVVVFGLFVLSLAAPNTQEIMRRYRPAEGRNTIPPRAHRAAFTWRPTVAWSLVIGAIGAVSIANLWRTSPFLYFQF
ncbi:MAG: MBOAT family protein [Alphaproteobacteria bacterium]|nr:MBOAT family protein [Alphaproteobacteria bacterium]